MKTINYMAFSPHICSVAKSDYSFLQLRWTFCSKSWKIVGNYSAARIGELKTMCPQTLIIFLSVCYVSVARQNQNTFSPRNPFPLSEGSAKI